MCSLLLKALDDRTDSQSPLCCYVSLSGLRRGLSHSVKSHSLSAVLNERGGAVWLATSPWSSVQLRGDGLRQASQTQGTESRVFPDVVMGAEAESIAQKKVSYRPPSPPLSHVSRHPLSILGLGLRLLGGTQQDALEI